MKFNRIWIVICLIVVCGGLATSYTRQAIREESITTATAEAAAETVAGAPAQAPAMDAPAMEQPAGADVAAPDARMMQAEPQALAEAAEVLVEDAAVNAVMTRLMELDEEIARSHIGEQDTTTNSLKAVAESERKLWESELERFLGILEEKLPTEERDALFLEQKTWIREREDKAVAASRKQTGSALQELEYNRSQTETTRSRTYELAERYSEILADTGE